MNMLIHSSSITVTRALRNFARKQSRKLLKAGSRIVQIDLHLDTIAKKKNDQAASTAKFLIKIPGKDIVVRRRNADLYTAITDAANRAARALRKRKEKHSQRKRVADLGLDYWVSVRAA